MHTPFKFRKEGASEVFHFLSSPARRMQKEAKNFKDDKQKKKGTCAGVFIPCLDSILSVILFLRLPSITAQAGIIQTTVIIIICALSTFLTAISLSAIATNGKFGSGGAYYIISRTLGLEIGGALGLLYYLGMTMASALCALGGVEAFLLSIEGDTVDLEEVTNGALGGSYESTEPDFELNGEGLARRILQGSIEAIIENQNNPEVMIQSPQGEVMSMEQTGEILSTMQQTGEIQNAKEMEVVPDLTQSVLDTQTLSMFLVFVLMMFVATGYKSALNISSRLLFIVIILSIVSAVVGCIMFRSGSTHSILDYHDLGTTLFENIYPRYEPDSLTNVTPNFISLLALWYPSVTGILTGSLNSEELEQASTSIPYGTIGSVIVSTIIYISFSWLFGMTVANQTLKKRKFIVAAIAYPSPWMVRVGVLVSAISAALGYMYSATLILSAIASDSSMPILQFIQKGDQIIHEQDVSNKEEDSGSKKSVNRRALILTWMIASILTISGNLDHIAPMITVIYIIMFAGINFSCFLLGVLQSPGFRPTFRFYHWSVSLLGFFWNVSLALIIMPAEFCFVSGIFLILLTYNAKMIERRKDFGDVFDTLKYNVVTKTLESLSKDTTANFSAKNWRPQVLTFVDMDAYGQPTNLFLLSLSSQLRRGKGINIVVGLILRDLLQDNSDLDQHQSGIEDGNIMEVLNNGKNVLQSFMNSERMEGFPQVSLTTRKGMCDAAWSAILHSGLGPLSPNTILISYPSQAQRNTSKEYWSETDFIRMIKGVNNMKLSLGIFKGSHSFPSSKQLVSSGIIDVWWILNTGGLLLLLPHILAKNSVWGRGGAKVRIFAVLTDENVDSEQFEFEVKRYLKDLRIVATVSIIDMSAYSLENDMRKPVPRTGPYKSMFENREIHEQTIAESLCLKTNYKDIDDSSSTIIDVNDSDISVKKQQLSENTMEEGMQTIHLNRQRLKNAVALNEIMRLHSSCSNLLICNMPWIDSKYSSDFFHYVDTMCTDIDYCLLVRGSGNEVITSYA